MRHSAMTMLNRMRQPIHASFSLANHPTRAIHMPNHAVMSNSAPVPLQASFSRTIALCANSCRRANPYMSLVAHQFRPVSK